MKAEFALKEPFIEIKHLPINKFSRPGKTRRVTKIVDIHWIGNAGQHADDVARYFELLSKQDAIDNEADIYASANYVVGIDGSIIEMIPPDEVSYTAGGAHYTDFIAEKIGKDFTKNQYMKTPNWCSVSIEMCHKDWSGKFTVETLEKTAILAKTLLLQYGLEIDSLVRHYDITGKICPKWFVEHEDDFTHFKNTVENITIA